jgi:VanZ family protein
MDDGGRRVAGGRRLAMACRLLFFLAAAAALAAALIPPEDHPPQLLAWDKANHALAFAVLMALGMLGLPDAAPAAVGLGLVLFGGAIELLQATPLVHRDCDLMDVLADAVGVLAAAWPALVLRRRLRLGRRGDSAGGEC